ncbi:uncharacterized protein LOC101460688 [Ceratitis capitata]|uniref:uncharacterized protein LOC101460688 n=1 Tax=Ceratitis capitata TaxID=7213 RepID=UPI0003299F82|nr:uncharacterized protein LOC101460688 [Ceratitis capitata]
MFRPIKNLISYIQKNASGSAIFGSSTAVADTETETQSEVGIEATKDIQQESKEIGRTEKEIATEVSLPQEKTHLPETADEQMQQEHIKRGERSKMNVASNANKAQPTVQVVNGKEPNGIATYGVGDCDVEDDIEMQIKSSVMLRPPLKQTTSVVENLTDEIDDTESEDVLSQDSQNEYNDAMGADSQDEYVEYPPISLLSDDGTFGAGEDTVEEFITEEEDADELTRDRAKRFEDSEIIVLSDGEINCSIASDALSEDPLAIDDFTQPSLSGIKDTSNPLDSSTNDEASTSGDLLWMSIDEVKTNKTKPNAEKDLKSEADTLSSQSTSQRQLIITTETKEKRNTNVTASGSNKSAEKLNTQHDEHAEEIRSDGSDSGLGSETSTLQTTLADTSHLTATSDTSVANTPTCNKTKATTIANKESTTSNGSNVTLTDGVTKSCSAVVPVTVIAAAPSFGAVMKPLRSNLKRRLEDDEALIDSPQKTQLATTSSNQIKKLKRSINFENVQVYYFPRQQGFGCVPSAGGCTLGMGARHIGFKTLTLAEHAAELRRAHRLQLQEINPRGSSSDDSEESEEDYLSEGSGSDLDAESNGFLQPVSPKQRRALLKAAGVRKIDAAEKIECRDIRNSREICGCACVEFCDPETCACSQAGIKCQVDRAMFPCGCTRDACGNTVGRVEFNPTRVRTHFIHTIMRLEMENRQRQNPPLCATMSSYTLSAACATSSAVVGPHTSALPPTPSYANTLPGSYYAMQTQSNYSSGYASPAYPSEPAANYYQQQSSTSTTTHYSTVSTNDLQTIAQQQQQSYQLDTLDGDLFASAATATPVVYGEMMPAYSSGIGGVAASTATVSSYHQNINYSTQVSTYSAYQQTTNTSGYLTQPSAKATAQPTLTPPTTYSSCAVPSLPPYGTATTTAAAAQYQDTSSYALVDTTAPSCITMEDSGGSDAEEADAGEDNCPDANNGTTNATATNTSCNTTAIGGSSLQTGNEIEWKKPDSCVNVNESGSSANESGSSFIQLSTPISSVTRLSQINDLLEHNRHTTATLVSVSHTTCLSANGSGSSTTTTTNTLISSRSVTTDCDYTDSSSNSNSQDKLGKEETETETEIENKNENEKKIENVGETPLTAAEVSAVETKKIVEEKEISKLQVEVAEVEVTSSTKVAEGSDNETVTSETIKIVHDVLDKTVINTTGAVTNIAESEGDVLSKHDSVDSCTPMTESNAANTTTNNTTTTTIDKKHRVCEK